MNGFRSVRCRYHTEARCFLISSMVLVALNGPMIDCPGNEMVRETEHDDRCEAA